MQPALQDNQLMPKHRVLSLKPQLRLEWRGPARSQRNRAARSFRQLRRFHHIINPGKVFGTHRLFYGETLPNTAHDIKAARDVAALIVREGSVDAYIEFCRRETRALLLNHAAAVLAIADALIRHRTIDRIQIDTIMRANG